MTGDERRVTGEAWRRFTGTLLAIALIAFANPGSARETVVVPEIAAAELPREARETLKLIERGGPFPYERDGIVFGNRERRLPLRAHGYYREYTVPTPDARDRGARRIVAGGCAGRADKPGAVARGQVGTTRSDSGRRFVAPCASAEYYYTDDHYGSFRRIRE